MSFKKTYTLMNGEDTEFSSNTVSPVVKSFMARILNDQCVNAMVWEESESGCVPY